MVLHKREAAKRYLEILKSFGMEISLEKSLIPSKDIKVAEIAKRYFRNGIDISPIPPKVLIESTKNLEGFLEFIEVLASRTDRFRARGSALDLSEAINLIWETNKDYGKEHAHATLTCPINGYFPFLDSNREGLMLLTKLPSSWNRSLDSLIKNLLDRFILQESVNALNSNDLVLTTIMPSSSRRPTALGVTPIVSEYLALKRQELVKVIKVYSGNYIEGEDDAFALDPTNVYKYLISEPDPLKPQDFLVKRRIRRKRGLGLIAKFWDQNKRMISAPIPVPQADESTR
jgi:hypothetical protein